MREIHSGNCLRRPLGPLALGAFPWRGPQEVFVAAVCLLLMAAAGTPGRAQEIRARTGEVPAETVAQEFASPMVLELSFPRVLDLQRDQHKNLGSGLRDFICDDVSIYHLAIRRGRTVKAKKGRPAKTELAFFGHLRVRESHDRLVTLTFSLARGEERLIKVSTGRFEAEEVENTRFEKRFWVPVAKLEDLYGGDEAPQLEVVLQVVDD